MYWLSYFLSQRYLRLALRDTALIWAVMVHLGYVGGGLVGMAGFLQPDAAFLLGLPLTYLILFAVGTVSIALNPPQDSKNHAIFLFVFLYLSLMFSGQLILFGQPIGFVGGSFGLLVTGFLALILSSPIRRYMGWSDSAPKKQLVALPPIKMLVFSLRDGAIISAIFVIEGAIREFAAGFIESDVFALLAIIMPEICLVIFAAIAISLRPMHGSGSYALLLFLWILIIEMVLGIIFFGTWGDGILVVLMGSSLFFLGVAIAWGLSYPIRGIIQKRTSP